MLFGLLLVVVSAAGFGAALFGRRPIPQPATAGAVPALTEVPAEAVPSGTGDGAQLTDSPLVVARPGRSRRGSSTPTTPPGVLPVGRLQRLVQREPTADHEPAVTFSAWDRLRSAAALTLALLGIGTIIGCVITIVVVGAVFVLT